MARINIEDSIYQDQRFIDLCIKLGSLDHALGSIIRAWSIGQKYFVAETHQKIPKSEWVKHKLNSAIIEVGLAREDDDGIWVCGAKEQFEWLAERIESGRKGGKKSVQNRPRDEKGRLLNAQANTKLIQAELGCESKLHQASSSSSLKENNNKRKVKFTPQSSAQFVELLGREFLNSLLKIYPDKKHIEDELEKIILWANNKDRVATRSERGWRRTVSTWLAKSWKDRVPDHDKQKPMRYADV